MKYYFLYVFASVDPNVHGPFDTEEERDAKALEFWAEEGSEEDGIFRADVNEDGELDVYGFAGDELEGDEDGEN